MPLTEQTLKLFGELRALTGGGAWLFPLRP